MEIIEKVLTGVYDDLELRKSIVPLFIGNPGLGKTKIIEKFARDREVKLVEFITSQRNPFEISGMAMPDKDIKKMAYWDFDTLLEMKDGDILFFDELLNGNPVVLNACLTILEQRKMISGKPLPNILICAAANPQGMCPLTPQIKERFVWYETKFDMKLWADYMMEKYSMPKTIISKLSTLIKDEKFTGNNFYTPRSIDKAVNMLLNDVPTPYKTVILPILEEFITNSTDLSVKLNDETDLLPNEAISWLKLIKYKKNK